jgi:hypothetical protein
MNKNNAAEFLPLVQALSEGKTLQYRWSLPNEWEDMNDASFVSDPEDYRIKPDPMEFEGITQATSRCHNDDSGMIRLTVNWPSAPPKIGTKFRLIEII